MVIKAFLPGFVDTPIFRQGLLSVCISLSYFCVGLIRGFSAPAFPSIMAINGELLPNKEIESWAGSIPPLGATAGSLFAGPLMHFLGRKYTVLLTSPIWIVAWSLIATAPSWEYLVVGRFLCGFGVGLVLPSAQIYVSECTDSKIRGVIGSFPALSMSAGILCSYVLGDLLYWNQLAWTSSVISMFVLAIAFLPESPVWLMGKKKEAQANASREWLRLDRTTGSCSPIEKKESDHQVVAMEQTKNGETWKVLFTRPILMPMLIGLTLLLIQQVSGIDAVIFFTVDIFRASGSSIDSNVATIIVGLVQLASNVLALFVVDRSGRKPLLIVSGIVMSISMAFMGVAYHLNAIGNHDYGLVPLISLIVFMIGFSVGFGSIPFLLMGEIFPARQRGVLSSIAITFNVAAMFTVIKTFQPLEEAITSAGTFWMYSVFCAAGVVFVIFCVPETKGRELDGMAKVFRKSFRVLAGKSRTKIDDVNNTKDSTIIESTRC